MMLNKFYVDDIIKTALLEDINYVDAATDYLIPEDQEGSASFIAKADGVLAGLEIALRVFELLQPDFRAEIFKRDGDELKKGEIIATVSGKTRTLLKGERTALNLLQHMSGVATATNKAVKIIEGTGASIADTRKITNAVKTLRSKLGHTVKIELEVRNLDELREALSVDVDIIMLDNMSCEDMREAVKITNGRAKLEASGGITDETLRAVAETGVDIISMGAITHSVTAFDISLKINK